MRIGELAKRVGVNPKTIRYYESIGLLPEPQRTTDSYRSYDEDDVLRLAFIRRATEVNLQLDEIREALIERARGLPSDGARYCPLVEHGLAPGWE